MKSNFVQLSCLGCGNNDFYVSNVMFDHKDIEVSLEIYACEKCDPELSDDQNLNGVKKCLSQEKIKKVEKVKRNQVKHAM